jgi:hypothetical protein
MATPIPTNLVADARVIAHYHVSNNVEVIDLNQ